MELDSPMRSKLERFARVAQRFQESETMPTVFTVNGLRVVIFLRDHRPAHVHVLGQDNHARLRLHCPDGPVAVDRNDGFSPKVIRLIKRELNSRVSEARSEWEKLHGPY